MNSENQLTQAPEAAPAEAAAVPGDTAPAAEDLAAALAALAAERDQLAAEKAELQDLLLRRQAEFENFRRRTERERIEFSEYAAAEVVKSLLPILDDFERALQAGEAAAEGVDGGYRRGVELIYQRLLDALKKAGLEPLECQGQPFDPNVHQAVDRAETAEAPDHTVLAVYQQGYNFKGKLLRAAMVKVAVAPA